MAGLLSKFKNIIEYKEPKNKPFRLPEGEDDSYGNSSEQGMAQEESNGQSAEECKKNKIPKTEKNISFDLGENLNMIKQELNVERNKQVIIREFKIGRSRRAFLVFILGISDRKVINESILRQLMNPEYFGRTEEANPIDYIEENVLSIHLTNRQTELNKISMGILRGFAALFIDKCNECLLLDVKLFEKRGVEKPTAETVVKGSQEAFTEDITTNLSIMRRLVKNKNLIVENIVVGKVDNSRCAIVYLDDVANEEIVKEVKRRIKSLDVDFLSGEGIIEQLIEDNPFSIFPQILSTERPDRVVSFIMEGKVAIFVEGSPFMNIVPITFFHLLHTSEDHLLRWQYGTFLRLVRTFAFFIAIYLPAIYVALVLFHQEMVPTELLVSIAKTRETVPFPVVLEVLFMELAFELIREAGIRVPGVIGQTLGIIGALILGEAAVAAGLVSPILIIIVSVTGLGNFAIPNYSLAIAVRIIRFVFLVLASLAGLYGIVIGTFIIGSLASNIKSFGVPFFAPIAPRTKMNRDLIIRAPIWKLSGKEDFMNSSKKNRKNKDPRGWVNKNTGDDNE